jgi:hypothetical protein
VIVARGVEPLRGQHTGMTEQRNMGLKPFAPTVRFHHVAEARSSSRALLAITAKGLAAPTGWSLYPSRLHRSHPQDPKRTFRNYRRPLLGRGFSRAGSGLRNPRAALQAISQRALNLLKVTSRRRHEAAAIGVPPMSAQKAEASPPSAVTSSSMSAAPSTPPAGGRPRHPWSAHQTADPRRRPRAPTWPG